MLIFFVLFAQNQSHKSIVKLSFLKQNCIEISKFLEKFLYNFESIPIVNKILPHIIIHSGNMSNHWSFYLIYLMIYNLIIINLLISTGFLVQFFLFTNFVSNSFKIIFCCLIIALC